MSNLSIKNLPVDDRPREKMLLKGVPALSDAELLAILIGSGTREETAVQLSQRILGAADNSLSELGRIPVKRLMSNFKGIGQAKAVTIVAALELGRRRTASGRVNMQSIRYSKDAQAIFYSLLCDLEHEEIWVALTNASSRVTEKIKIGQGNIEGTPTDIRMIMRAALQSAASGIILCHNHPSGNVRPSCEDDALTARTEEAARIMGLRLLDHIIISGEDYYSYADEGRISAH